MDRKEIWDLVRRIRLRLVVDNSKLTVMKQRRRKSAILLDQDISYQTLPSYENSGANDHQDTTPDIIGHKLRGAAIAPPPYVRPKPEQQELNFISNAGALNTSDDKEIPSGYEFEILRLRRRVDELECIVRDRDRRIVSAIAMLEDELMMYRTLLHAHVAETHDGVQRRTLQIESTLDTLKEKGSKFYPPLPIPKHWQKK